MPRPGVRGVGVLLAATLAISIAACGDDESDDSASSEESASAEEVTVTAKEYSFDLSATPTADTREVTFDNQGKEFHVMVFARINEGFTLDEAVELEGREGSAKSVAETEAAPGKTTTVKTKQPIEPGEYVMLCPIESKEGPHYKLGQLQEFSID